MAERAAEGAILLTRGRRRRLPGSQRRRAAGTPRRSSSSSRPRQQTKADARGPIVDSIAARLNDYSASMPAAERLQLMDRLRELAPNVSLPTQAALRLSIEMLDAERPAPIPEVVRQTATADVWALTSEDQRVIAFYRIGRRRGDDARLPAPDRAERHHLPRRSARHARRLGSDRRWLVAARLATLLHADRVGGARRGPTDAADRCTCRSRWPGLA